MKKVVKKKNSKKTKEQPKQIRVTVQREDRLRAINNLSEAILAVARALHYGCDVSISGCLFTSSGGESGISISTEEEVTRTEILELERHS